VKKKKTTTMGRLLGCLCVVAGGLVGLSAQAQPRALVIEGGTLIDGNGGTPVTNAVVVIEGNRITNVSRVGQVTYPPNAEVIDARGKFVLPGLWDAMVSYQWYYGEIMLNYGITSTVDVGIAGEVGAAFRDGVLKGKIRGPRPFTGISRITTEDVGGTGLETILTPGRAPKSAEETRELVRAIIDGGADVVMFQDGTLPLDYYRAGFDEAKKAGMPVTTRAYGPIFGPREAAELGTKMLPHSAGIGTLVTKNPPAAGDTRNEADLYADMDEGKARELIQFLVGHHVALDPTYRNSWMRYPRDWERMGEEDRNFFDHADPDLMAYYPRARMEAQLEQYRAPRPTGPVAERRMRGFKNSLRFHKMFVDAGGHLIPGSDSNPVKVPGINLFHEFMVFTEAGVKPMQIIQGATKWSAEVFDKDDELGTIEAGKIADVIIVNQDPLRDVQNLRDLDAVVFDGKRVRLGYTAGYNPVFRVESELNPPVSRLLWVNAFRPVAFGGTGGRFNGRPPVGPGKPLPDPVDSPQPAIETISPLQVTAGSPTTTVTLTGFNFVRRSEVLFKGIPVPYKAVSGSELEVTIDASLLQEPGWHEIVVKNPWPLHPEIGAEWGNGTSNAAHLIVAFGPN
jgi:Amidohydrolase family/IPT/TIG domain